MNVITSVNYDGKALTLGLSGNIDTKNAPHVETEIAAARRGHPDAPLVLDFSALNYISSAGLRVLLRLKKAVKDLWIINVSSDVYEVFDMTGFTMMMNVRKAYREMSVEGCPIIGQGAKGILYRIDPETVCKVYRNPDSLDEILRERELAKAAFVAGIPTAISFDVVRVGDGYGSVFELLEASTVSALLADGTWGVERAADVMADLLKQLSQTTAKSALIPPILKTVHGWVDRLEGVLDAGSLSKIRGLVQDLPEEPTLIHGDFHINNVMVQDDEPLLIDLDTLSYGNGIFDLAITYSTHVGRGLLDSESSSKFLGIPYSLSVELWDLMLRSRFPEASAEELSAIEDKLRLVSAVRLMGRPCKHKELGPEVAQKTFDIYGAIIDEVLPRVDSLAL